MKPYPKFMHYTLAVRVYIQRYETCEMYRHERTGFLFREPHPFSVLSRVRYCAATSPADPITMEEMDFVKMGWFWSSVSLQSYSET